MKQRMERMNQTYQKPNNSSPPFPHSMLLELNDTCNLKCIYCANRVQERTHYMDLNFAKKVMMDAYNLGTREIGFYMGGEPTLSPIICNCIRYAKSIGYEYVYIDTNGVCRFSKLESIINAGLDSIKFSISAGTSETYRKIHGLDCFDIVVNNIKSLGNMKKKQGLSFNLFVSYVITKQNQKEFILLKQIVEEYVDEVLELYVGTQGGHGDVRSLSTVELISPIPCPLPFNRFHVQASGFVSACCTNYYKELTMGNLHKNGMKEIWDSEMFISFRSKHLNYDVADIGCGECEYKL